MPSASQSLAQDLVHSGDSITEDSWLVSDWAAGQSSVLQWSSDNVRTAVDGAVEYVLSAADTGATRPYEGGETQSMEAATTGTWSWTAQAPEMVDGAVFGLFTYREDWQTQPWVEFDFEFVGADTTKVQLNIHMEDANGTHVSLDQSASGPVVIDLGFDASEGAHTYTVTVGETEAVFLVDGHEVARFSAEDMPGGVWQIGAMRSFVNLWAVAPEQEGWAGTLETLDTPLVGRVLAVSIEEGNVDNLDPATSDALAAGDSTDNLIAGTVADDVISGLAGDDTLLGGAGNDSLYGGLGNDHLHLDAGNDLLDGGGGVDEIVVSGTRAATIDLSLTQAQSTGYGLDRILNIENVTGGAGADRLLGSDQANRLMGLGGNDVLRGRAGDDVLTGGGGSDKLYGGEGNDTLSLDLGNDVIQGGDGQDWLVVSGNRAAVIDLAKTSAQVTGYGQDTIQQIENLSGGAGVDRLSGNAGANILLGNGGADTLKGGAGADQLTGGLGKDLLYGGVDAVQDVFAFASVADSAAGTKRDVIYDFVSGIDLLDVSALDADTGVEGDGAFDFAGRIATSHALWFTQSGSDILLHGDVNGDAKADFEVKLVDVLSLSASDFLL